MLEVALIVIAVAAALAGMGMYLKRSIKANFKMTQDKVNAQPGITVDYHIH